jgi:acetylornithine deacetylase/succinyl-diaminopimelate desuccinylase-like protein
MWPGVPLVPTMATGFSDFDENRAHGRDERVGVQAFDESVEFTYRLVKTMGRDR